MVYYLILIVWICLVVFWVLQFVNFMRMKPEEFENQQDRLIWGAAFCFVFFAAPFAFIIWKMMYEPPDLSKRKQTKEEGDGSTDDDPDYD